MCRCHAVRALFFSWDILRRDAGIKGSHDHHCFSPKFHQGEEVAAPFKQVLAFLQTYGEAGSAGFEHEISFLPDTIVDVASVVGDEAGGALCVTFERPVMDAQFRNLVSGAMQQFGFAAYADTFDWVYVLKGRNDLLPQALLDELTCGRREAGTAGDLWPQEA